jgi:hypothetical protein
LIAIGDANAPEVISLSVLLSRNRLLELESFMHLGGVCARATLEGTMESWAEWIKANAVDSARPGMSPSRDGSTARVQLDTILTNDGPLMTVTIRATR